MVASFRMGRRCNRVPSRRRTCHRSASRDTVAWGQDAAARRGLAGREAIQRNLRRADCAEGEPAAQFIDVHDLREDRRKLQRLSNEIAQFATHAFAHVTEIQVQPLPFETVHTAVHLFRFNQANRRRIPSSNRSTHAYATNFSTLTVSERSLKPRLSPTNGDSGTTPSIRTARSATRHPRSSSHSTKLRRRHRNHWLHDGT